MNSLNVSGNLGGDMEVKTTGGGMEVGRFSIFIKGFKKGGDGGFWLNITHFKPNDFLKDVLKKGQSVSISGRLDISSHDKKYYTNMISNTIDVYKTSDGSSQSHEDRKEAAAENNESTDNDDLPF